MDVLEEDLDGCTKGELRASSVLVGIVGFGIGKNLLSLVVWVRLINEFDNSR